MKNNRGFRRFLLRGLSKVTLEVGWLSLAHNLLKQPLRIKNENELVSNNPETGSFFYYYSFDV
nr:transposase [Paenibacillus wynnii]